ncbi:MAG: aminotransferase class IV [Chloroflexota bacterium]
MAKVVYLNGSLVPRERAAISVLDYGFLYGYGLFETMRAYQGRVFLLDRHLDRLESAAAQLGLPVSVPELAPAVRATIQANGLTNARVRLTVSRGEGSLSPDPGTCQKATVLIVAEPYRPYPARVYRSGLRAVTASSRRNSQSPLSRLKTANFLESILARQEAKKAGADDALLLNEKGMLAEASMSNLFLVSRGIIMTPGLSSGVLPGITRGVVLELAAKLGIETVEAEIPPEAIIQAEEAFLTNSLIEVMPLVEIDGQPVALGQRGTVTARLHKAYRALVRQTIKES